MENYELLSQKLRTRISSVEIFLSQMRGGRGGELRGLFQYVLDVVIADLDRIDRERNQALQVEPGTRQQILELLSNQLERLEPVLDNLHIPLATYREAVARADVPVGLQHLIDVLMEEIIPSKGDPIIHLDSTNMYSTYDLASSIGETISKVFPQASNFDGTHPIVFNLPALDPSNVLLAPVLAHEVAHTAVDRKLMTAFLDELAGNAAFSDINIAFQSLEKGDQEEARRRLFAWTEELLCDAVAITMFGPSYMFAFTSFVPPTNTMPASPSHPDIQERMGYSLRLVDALGWRRFLEENSPGLLRWLEECSLHPVPVDGSVASFLRVAIERTSLLRQQIALSHIEKPFECDQNANIVVKASPQLAAGVPIGEIEGVALTTSEVVLAAWMGAVLTHGDRPGTLALAAGDLGYNNVVVKALENCQIVRNWQNS